MRRWRFAMSLLCVLMQGCFMQPVSLPEIHHYQLTAVSTPTKMPIKTNKTLLVSLPQAFDPYQTHCMVYTQTPHQIGFLAKNQWIAPLPQMLLPCIVKTMRENSHFKIVVGFPSVVNTDYRLDTQWIDFREVVCGRKSYVHLELDAILIDNKTQSIVQTKSIEVCVPMRCITPTAAVEAYQLALNCVLAQLYS